MKFLERHSIVTGGVLFAWIAITEASCLSGGDDSDSNSGGTSGGSGDSSQINSGCSTSSRESGDDLRAILSQVYDAPGVERASRSLASAIVEGSEEVLSVDEATIEGDAPLATAACASPGGTAWVPSVTGAAPGNHVQTISVLKNVYTTSGKLTGLDQSYSASGSHVLTISGIDMSQDLGTKGSLSLVAEVTGFPSGSLVGGAWPVLISLSDGTREWVKMSGCEGGYYRCCNGLCSRDSACAPQEGSAYLGTSSFERRYKWEQHQKIGTSDYLSANSFPTCDWSSGSPSCPFTSDFLVSGKLPTGTYTAKYILLTSNYSSVGESYSAGLKLTVLRKQDSDDDSGSPDPDGAKGAIDINVILVGSANVEDSRTAKGKQNLDELFNHVYSHFFTENSATTGIKLGQISVYEWGCGTSGEAYANVDIDDTGDLFKDGSNLVNSSSESKAVNVFLVSTIPYGGSGTVLGLAGGIVGAMINGTTSSGVVFSTFNQLDTYNDCTPGGACPIADQDPDFIDMGNTISHEIGHFLGLNHPSESGGTTHDRLPDTPQCSKKSSGASSISITSCLQETACAASCGGYLTSPYCPTVDACQFNHVMWWTGKNFSSSTGEGDGSIFSAQSGKIINYSPYVQ